MQQEYGYDVTFEKNLEGKYVCPLCHKALRNPLQTQCGHRFCEKCLEPLLRGPDPKCPVDGEVLMPDGVFRDVCCRREILCLFCYCLNYKHGCEWKKELQYLEEHLVKCEYNEVPCKNPGCNERIPEIKFEEHMKVCPYNPTTCQYCLQPVPAANLEAHFEVCQKIPVACTGGCGSKYIPRDELAVHLTTYCDQAEILCRFKKIGCDFKGTRDDVEQHYIDQNAHLNLVAKALETCASKEEEMSKELEKNAEDKRALEVLVDQQRNALAETRQNLTSYQGRLNTAEKTIGEHRRDIAEMRRLVEGTRCQDTTNPEQIAMQFEEVRAALQEHDQKLGNIQRGIGRGGASKFQGPSSMGVTPMSMERRQDRNEHQLALHDIQLAEHDLKIQMLEATSYDGTYIWKIDEYSRRYQEGVSGKTPSIYSPPFYVGRYGYKVCARVYTNGDGMGKGTHLSLFFVIMRGEYDALLPWPFRQKVTFKLLDHDRQENVGDTFRPDPSSSSFKRPTANMNIASGCPLFISNQSLQSHAYVKDDTLFIKIVIETTGLPPMGL